MDIQIIRQPTPLSVVKEAALQTFGDMVKAVVDVDRRVMAVGGEMHSDAERVLLDDGSNPPSLWGINVFPERPAEERIEYTSLINIRPSRGNRSMEIADPAIREAVRTIVDQLIVP